ncbi:choice-of-anchor Q domain-containing protein, partial [uncultured Rubinisphaera sp.]|uniref:beta strand repeat-containing protein n=1 Tax=uncultured Rubinisphaera sp. TaxID=1678686 RepID=UPI0030D77491
MKMLSSGWLYKFLCLQKSKRRFRQWNRELASEALESRTLLTTYTVNTLLDQPANASGVTDGLVSLREAINAANSNAAFGDAVAGSGSETDVINFDASLAGETITLGGEQLIISDNLSINGLGANQLSINANDQSRVFRVTPSITAEISGLTITAGNANGTGEGDSGGGILNGGTLFLRGVTVNDNNSNKAGGGIESTESSNLTITNSSIYSNNSRTSGGGISVYGNAKLINSSIIGNSSYTYGGGIDNNGALEIINCTISSNLSSRAVPVGIPGGGISASSGTVLLHNTIVAGNLSLYFDDFTNFIDSDINGTVDFNSQNNLIGDAGSSGGLTEGGFQSNMVGINGTGTRDINTIFDTSFENNGGSVRTYALLENSIAVNAGNNSLARDENNVLLTSDGRGGLFSRFGAGGSNGLTTVDIGAYEFQPRFEVNTLEDETTNNETFSLREAIEAANAQEVGSNIGGVTDLITFNSALAGGTITLAGNEILIEDSIDIMGLGADKIAISGNDQSRIFNIGNQAAATISGLTLTGGDELIGGAIYSNGNLTVSNSIITGNSADVAGGGIYSDGNTLITNSTISGNSTLKYGGGIYSRGSLTISNSTVSGNTAGYDSGGIRSEGVLNIINATISGNDAFYDGGGIKTSGTTTITDSKISGNLVFYDGGGVYSDGVLTITNSTISNNSAGSDGGGISIIGDSEVVNTTISGNKAGNNGGGVFNLDDTTTIVNSTITGNRANSNGGGTGIGGGIWTYSYGGTFTTLLNSIVAGNYIGTGDTSNDIANYNLEVGSTNNIIGDATSAGGLINGINNNIVGVSVLDVLDTTLSDNGGPTLTHAIISGSDALNNGSNQIASEFSLTTDQRGTGFERIFGGTVDVGAFEQQNFMLTVDTEFDVTDENDGLTSLREAIAFANSNRNSLDSIQFDSTLTGKTILLDGTELIISDALDLIGLGADKLTISGNNQSRIFNLLNNTTATISGLTLTGGNASEGGSIYSSGNLTVTNSTITNNSSENDGGGIFSFGNIIVKNSTISGNSSLYDGGAIRSSGTLTITNSTISENSAVNNGGAIFSSGTTVVINSTISGNSSDKDGGGIFNVDDYTNIINSTIIGNRADSDGNNDGTGGGLWTYNDGITFTTLQNSIVAGNFVGTGTTANDVDNKNLETGSTNNVIGDASSAGGLVGGTNGNIVGVNVHNLVDIILRDNGGPTLTHALLSGSIAINRGNNTLAVDADMNPLTTDQRGSGFDRIIGGRVDIGAYESS